MAPRRLAHADARERRRGAGHVVAILVQLRGLEEVFERRHEVREVEMAARHRMSRLGVEIAVAALGGQLARLFGQREGASWLAVTGELGRQRVERAHARRPVGGGVDGVFKGLQWFHGGGPREFARNARRVQARGNAQP